MAELNVETLTDFSRKLLLMGEGEQINRVTLLEYIKPHTYDQKLRFVSCNEFQIGGDAKPPLRICNPPPPKSSEQLAEELTEKMEKTTTRREQILHNIVQKSRQYNEKITKVREKMAARRAEISKNVEKELLDRRSAVEKKREKVFCDRLQKIRKHMEYAQIVRDRKAGTESEIFVKPQSNNDERDIKICLQN